MEHVIEIVIVESVNRDSPSYELGFASGARAGEYGARFESPADMYLYAIESYHRSALSVVLDRDSFIGGWVDGYHGYLEGLA